jgi:hypothetical protein
MSKNLFRYYNGTDFVYADPFAVDTRFARAALHEDLNLLEQWIANVPRDDDGAVVLNKFSAGDQQLYMEACLRYVPLICAALEIKQFDTRTGEGMTSEDVLLVWRDFNEWRSSVKKNTEELPSSPTPTEESVPNTSPPAPSMGVPPIPIFPDRGPVPSQMKHSMA